MNKFMSSLEKVLMPLAEKIGQNKLLIAIRDGFLVSSPLLIIGSIFLLIANFPIPGWTEFWAQFFGPDWTSNLSHPVAATFDVMTLLAVFGIGYSYAKQTDVDPIASAAVAMVAFFILTPFSIGYTPEGATEAVLVSGIPLGWMGSKGMFVGMITAITSVKLFGAVTKKGWVIKMPDGVPPTVAKSFAALIPSAVVMVVYFIINTLFGLTPYGSVHEFIYKFLQMPLLHLGNSLGAMVIAYIFLHFFWFFGINGGSVVGAVYNPILKILSAENLEAFKAGVEIPNIITGQFQDMFATFGGAGSTLSLLIAMVLICKSKRIKSLGKLSVLPGIFGINEPIIFGLPVILNPLMLIPLTLAPIVSVLIAIFAMKIGFLSPFNGVVAPWPTPPIFSGFLVSGWQGALVQVVAIAAAFAIYYPFVLALDKQYRAEELTEELIEA